MAELGFCGLPLSVPLFAELYGYGPFRGRRNLGTRDTLYCRAIALGDSSGRRIVEIVSDVCVTDDVLARTLRAEIAAENCIHPNGIMFGAIHTHTGPAVSLGIGWGEICPEFMDHLKRTIKEAAAAALREETGELTVFVINADRREEQVLKLDVRGFEGWQFTEHLEMFSEQEDAQNTWDHPDRILPVKNSGTRAEKGILTAQLKKESWNVLRFSKK